MTLSVMILLGVGLSAICGVIARRTIASALHRQPSALPLAPLMVTLVLIYSGWAFSRWLATLEASRALHGNLFIYSAVAYAVCQLDVVLFAVSRVEGPARSNLRMLWLPLQRKRFRVWGRDALGRDCRHDCDSADGFSGAGHQMAWIPFGARRRDLCIFGRRLSH
jgi:hypothetical protein